MQIYGRLYGFIVLIKDTHHDEVFIGKTKLVVMRNNIWLYDTRELREIAMQLGYNPYKLCRINYRFTPIDWEELEWNLQKTTFQQSFQ